METIKEIARKCEPGIAENVNSYVRACGTAYVYYSENSDCYYATPDEHMEHDQIAVFNDLLGDFSFAEVVALIQAGLYFNSIIHSQSN